MRKTFDRRVVQDSVLDFVRACWHVLGAPTPERPQCHLTPHVHTPQAGKAITKQYLAAAFRVFGNESFRYVREITGDRDAVLEFQVEIEGISVNGVDIIKWDEAGQIVELKVMLRPLKAVDLIHQKMAAMLQAKQSLV